MVPQELLAGLRVLARGRDVVARAVGAGRNAFGRDLHHRLQHRFGRLSRGVRPGEDGGGIGRPDHRPNLGPDLNEVQNPGIHGHVGVHHCQHRAVRRCLASGERHVDGPQDLGVRSVEVHDEVVPFLRNFCPDGVRPAAVPVILHDLGAVKVTVGQLLDHPGEASSRVLDGLAHTMLHCIQPVFQNQ